jgi:prepilin-type N-terminal cleavage/methylation domain-containing protein
LHMNGLYRKAQGFTLAELLIALGILGVIATFTIPKVLFSAQGGQNTAVAKEAASMISGAYTSYTLQNGTVATDTTAGAFTQYMNYVAEDTAATTAAVGGKANCSATLRCYRLHNGGVLQLNTTNNFNGSASTNAIYYNLDPDGAGVADPVTFVLYYNGRLSTAEKQAAGTATGGTPVTTVTGDPSYIQNWN